MLALVLLACSSDPALPAVEGPPDLVLVLTSGLREDVADGGATSAFLAQTGVPPDRRYTAAYSQTVQPYTALGSLLTGRYPSAIPLCSRSERAEEDAEVPFCVDIPAEIPTLPEVLTLYGYETALLAVDVDPLLPVARGFGETMAVSDWSMGVAQARDWWAQTEGSPRLLVVASSLTTPQMHAAATRAHTELEMSEADKAAYLTDNPWFADRLTEGMRWPILTEEGRALVEAAYTDAARESGRQVRNLLGELAWTRPRWTVLSALHGLSIGEDSGCRSPEQLRANSHIVLLDRTLRVPLLIYGPSSAGQTVHIDTPVELTDIVPTFTALAGAVPPAGLDGSDLLGEVDPEGVAYAEFGDMLVLRQRGTLLTFRSQLHGVTSADPRLTDRLLGTAPMSLSGKPEQMLHPNRPAYYEYLMHEVADDPLQRTMLPVGEDSPRFMELVALLLAHRTGPAAPPTSRLSWQQVQALRRDGALHYW